MTTHTSSNPGCSSSSLSSTFSHYWSGSSFCSSPLLNPSSDAVDVAAFVPFLWEEKPGISKQNAQSKEWQMKGGPAPQKSETFVLIHVSSKQRDLIVSPNDLSFEVRPLRPPPSMQNSSQFGHSKSRKAHDPSGMRLLSHSFPRGRQSRKLRQNDDPFLLAMEACTKPADRDSDQDDTSTKTVRKMLRKNSDQSSSPSHITYSSTSDQESGKRVVYANLKSFSTESENSATSRVRSDHVAATHRNSVVNNIAKGGQEKRFPRHSGCLQMENNCQAQEDEKTRRTERPKQADDKLQDPPKPVRDRLSNRADIAPSLQSSSARKFKASVQSRGTQSQSVELSCGQYRRFPPPPNNRQPLTDWFGCRSINNFEGAIVPLKSFRPVISEQSRAAGQGKLDTLVM